MGAIFYFFFFLKKRYLLSHGLQPSPLINDGTLLRCPLIVVFINCTNQMDDGNKKPLVQSYRPLASKHAEVTANY